MLAPPKDNNKRNPTDVNRKPQFSIKRLFFWIATIAVLVILVFLAVKWVMGIRLRQGNVGLDGGRGKVKEFAKVEGSEKRNSPKAAATNKVVNSSYVATFPVSVPYNKSQDVAMQVPDEKPVKVFTNAADQVLALAMDIRPGMDMPPLPPGATAGMTKEQLKAMFSADIVIDDDDPENIKELKLRVKDAREAMLERIEVGEDFDDVLGEYRRMINENAAVYRQCEDELRKIIAEGDEQAAIEYREIVNKVLNNMGIDSLTVPITADEYEELKLMRRERHRARMEKRRNQKKHNGKGAKL